MTKQYEGNIWTETDSRGVVKIGFSRNYIDQQLMECFHVMQADRSVARKGQPIMVLETNDGTTRIKSPVNGRILTFNGKARDFPDRLSEEDVIMEVLPEGVKLEPKKKVEYKDIFTVNNWVQQAEQAAVQPQVIDDVQFVAADRAARDEVIRRQQETLRRQQERLVADAAARARRRVR